MYAKFGPKCCQQATATAAGPPSNLFNLPAGAEGVQPSTWQGKDRTGLYPARLHSIERHKMAID